MKTYPERMEAVQNKIQRKRTQRKALIATTGTLCLCVAIAAVFPLFQNKDDISKYEGSKYYKVIQAIKRDSLDKNGGYYDYPVYGDLLDGDAIDNDMQVGGLPEAAAPGAVPDETPDYSYNGSQNESVEITDHQVAGVLEADIIKRSQTHIFYLNNTELRIYPIAGLETELLGKWDIPRKDDIYYNNVEMYLSADASRINLVISGYGNVFQKEKKSSFVQLISLDVTDPSNVQEVNNLYLTGSLLSTRMVGQQMLLSARYTINRKIDFDDESTFVPQVGAEGEMEGVNPDNIFIPDKLSSTYYMLVVLLDSREMRVIDTGAFMSTDGAMYVSEERLYVSRYTDSASENLSENLTMTRLMSEICCMAYDPSGLELKGSFKVEGNVKNQYCMDEYNGVFRVVTETTRVTQGYLGDAPVEATTDALGNTAPPDYLNPRPAKIYEVEQSANLTCFKVGTWEQLAQVEQFAPVGETVESVRFDGDYAYVCTAVVITLTDPVFFFDMTDINNITYKDTGTIEGYSSSLIQLRDGYLLGIGFNNLRNLKVEIYEEGENGVVSVCEYIRKASFATTYKAYYIDRENNLFGIPTGDGYILLQFDGYQLHELTVAKNDGILENVRGVVVDEYLYVFSGATFDVKKIG